jgi:hypothetical protein
MGKYFRGYLYCLHENPRLPDKCGIFDWRGIYEESNYGHCRAFRLNALLGLFHAARYACGY